MTQSVPNPAHQDAVIHGGPLFHALSRIGMSYSGGRTKFLCLVYAAVTWGAMALLTVVQGVFYNSALKIPFVFDVSEIARFLICGPLLIAAEPMIEPWLKNVVNQFRVLTPDAQKDEFNTIVARSTRMRELWWVEVLLIGFALLRPHIDPSIAFVHEVPSWQTVGAHASYAEIYCNFVAKPLMGCLWLRWLWKYICWSLLLCRIASLELRLIPTHPDDMAGLGFVAVGQAKFSLVVAALAVLVASGSADEILYAGVSFMEQRWIILCIVILSLVIFLTPLLAFTPKLIEVKRRGLFEYGQLAQEYVDAFDTKWIENKTTSRDGLLGHNDISTLADLENAFNIVQRMKIILIDKSILLSFVLSAIVPFMPLALTMISIEDLIDRLLKNFI
jgi:hypothetical protein